MRQSIFAVFVVAALCSLSATYARQAPPAAEQPFAAGTPLKMTPNARTYGGFRFAESVSYDAKRDDRAVHRSR